jgi:hypothetical protein
MDAELDAHLRAWGNSYGIAVPRQLAQRLGLAPGMPVHVKVSFEPARNDASTLPSWDWGGDYDIDAILLDDQE